MSLFTPAGSGGAVTTVDIQGAVSPTVAAVSLTSAGTEYSFVFPTNCKQFLLKLRDSAPLQVAYVAGTSGTTYLTVPANCFYGEGGLNLNSTLTIYFQSSSPSQTAEIVYWT